MSNIKVQRTNSDILRILSVTLRDKMATDFSSVTILNVETSADYSLARVQVEISGEETEKNQVFAELEKASGFLRNEVASRVKLRQTPQIRFVLDRGRENATRVEELLAQINSGK
ncbi:MAG: 30S ribosome-binding factor RbfA [Firmicutes bacterium]|nr:30S ribosome-binding factor RbfA [Bacillota bacterium]